MSAPAPPSKQPAPTPSAAFGRPIAHFPPDPPQTPDARPWPPGAIWWPHLRRDAEQLAVQRASLIARARDVQWSLDWLQWAARALQEAWPAGLKACTVKLDPKTSKLTLDRIALEPGATFTDEVAEHFDATLASLWAPEPDAGIGVNAQVLQLLPQVKGKESLEGVWERVMGEHFLAQARAHRMAQALPPPVANPPAKPRL